MAGIADKVEGPPTEYSLPVGNGVLMPPFANGTFRRWICWYLEFSIG